MIESARPPNSQRSLNILLPRLPSRIRYFDDFSDQGYSILNPEKIDQWPLFFDGIEAMLDFRRFEPDIQMLIKHWVAFMLCNEMAPATVKGNFEGLQTVAPGRLTELLYIEPERVSTFWLVLFAEHATRCYTLIAVKGLLRYLASQCLCGWSPDHLLLLTQLRLPKVDRYAAVRAGDAFLAVEEEAALVSVIDELTKRIQSDAADVSSADIERGAILICSYQFALRPKQIGMLKMRDVRIRQNAVDGRFLVHLTFLMIKQRSADRRLPLTRRVKNDWTPVFVELLRRKRDDGLSGSDRFFSVSSAHAVAEIIVRTTASILGWSRSATELRHTAAQRMVDAGAGEEELAHFLGHSDLQSGLVYFRTSASQTERVNVALGISETYKRVAKIAHGALISPEELARLKGTQQIGGVPHGIPITGIGGCSSGQPACPYNPVMSCYGCARFMPVRNADIHNQVLSDLRGIVKSFEQASRTDTSSPTYMQLRQTIAAVQAVTIEITGEQS